MNKVYKSKYNAVTGTYVAVSEHAKVAGKSAKSGIIKPITQAILALGMGAMSSTAFAACVHTATTGVVADGNSTCTVSYDLNVNDAVTTDSAIRLSGANTVLNLEGNVSVNTPNANGIDVTGTIYSSSGQNRFYLKGDNKTVTINTDKTGIYAFQTGGRINGSGHTINITSAKENGMSLENFRLSMDGANTTTIKGKHNGIYADRTLLSFKGNTTITGEDNYGVTLDNYSSLWANAAENEDFKVSGSKSALVSGRYTAVYLDPASSTSMGSASFTSTTEEAVVINGRHSRLIAKIPTTFISKSSDAAAIRMGGDDVNVEIGHSGKTIIESASGIGITVNDFPRTDASRSSLTNYGTIKDTQGKTDYKVLVNVGPSTAPLENPQHLLHLSNYGEMASSVNGYVLQNNTERKVSIVNNDGGVLDGAIFNNEAAGRIQLSNYGTWNHRNQNSKLSNLDHEGVIAFKQTDGIFGKKIEVTGAYLAAGMLPNTPAVLKVNVEWNAPGNAPGSSKSDQLIIHGGAYGLTEVIPVHNGTDGIIKGNVQRMAQAISTVPSVIVGTGGDDMVFQGTATTESGIQAQLAKRKVGSSDEYFWTIDGYGTGTAVWPGPDPFTYEPSVPGYVMMPVVNLEQGYASLGTLASRRGDNQPIIWNRDVPYQNQSWGRLYNERKHLGGQNRFGVDMKLTGFQFGHDFAIRPTTQGGHSLTGVFAGYSQSKSSFSDELRRIGGVLAEDKRAGRGKSASWHLGMSHTRYASNGAYLDLVGQLSHYRNTYEARGIDIKERQTGYGVVLSAEGGYPFVIGGANQNLTLEPQAQVMYQGLHLKSVHDGIREVNQGTNHSLRGRLGARLAYNTMMPSGRKGSVYAVANVWHDFTKPKGVEMGNSDHRIREKSAATWMEVGLGAQLPLSKQANFYADARYEKELGAGKRYGYKANVGFKYSW